MTRPNDAYVIQPLYVLPRDGKDNGLATNGTISRSVAAMQSWFADQTGGRRLRILAGTVATVRVGETEAQIATTGWYVRDRVEELLRDEGYADPYRIYAVWYDGTSTKTCGGGAWPPELIGHVAALYLRARYSVAGHQVDCSQNRYSSDGVTPGSTTSACCTRSCTRSALLRAARPITHNRATSQRTPLISCTPETRLGSLRPSMLDTTTTT
jgi:hypothetical protein